MVPVPLSHLQPSRIDAIEVWLSDGRQALEVMVGELLSEQPVPLL